MRGLFVTGTDTNVGKTVVSAALFHRYRMEEKLRYWKPVQTGFPVDDDTATVKALGRCSADEICEAGIRLATPLSPHIAASREGITIDSGEILAVLEAHTDGHAWIVEGAGGVLVPINQEMLMIDLMRLLGLPAVVVARTRLGTINQTLLTLEALRSRSIDVAGVVLVGDPNADNADSIAQFGAVDILGELPPLATLDAASLAEWSCANLDPNDRLIARMTAQ